MKVGGYTEASHGSALLPCGVNGLADPRKPGSHAAAAGSFCTSPCPHRPCGRKYSEARPRKEVRRRRWNVRRHDLATGGAHQCTAAIANARRPVESSYLYPPLYGRAAADGIIDGYKMTGRRHKQPIELVTSWP